jgi:hypothetical protein
VVTYIGGDPALSHELGHHLQDLLLGGVEDALQPPGRLLPLDDGCLDQVLERRRAPAAGTRVVDGGARGHVIEGGRGDLLHRDPHPAQVLVAEALLVLVADRGELVEQDVA